MNRNGRFHTHEGTGPDDITISEVADGFGPGVDLLTVALPAGLAGGGKLIARLSVAVAQPQETRSPPPPA